MQLPFDAVQLRFLKSLAEALFDDFEELAIPLDEVVDNVQQFFAMVGGTKASEISWSLRVAELAMAPLFHALSLEHRKDRIRSRMQNSQFDAFQDMAKLRSILYFGYYGHWIDPIGHHAGDGGQDANRDNPVLKQIGFTLPKFRTRGPGEVPLEMVEGREIAREHVLKIDQVVATARPTTGYGMTETCGIITSVTGDFFVAKPDSAGPSMPNFEVKCVDDDGEVVAPGAIGELWVKGSSVIRGYINRPDATATTITDGGWLHTGDVARIDEDGFIYIVDRKKDMVLRGGENVFCTEVEAGIYRHAAVAECCVFGVPDERLGEEVGVAIVLKDGDALDEAALRQHCLDVMAKHKVPRYIWFLAEALPRNASGKFLRRELRDELSKQLATS